MQRYLILFIASTVFSATCLANNSETASDEVKVEIKHKGHHHHKKHHKHRPKFSTLDSNSDGDISLEEFSQHPVPHHKHHKLFIKIDADNNNVISKQEFDDHKPHHHKNKREQHD